jgi:excisionase family DNA binding protein
MSASEELFLTPAQKSMIYRGVLTYKQAAQYLGMSEEFVRNEVLQKRLKVTVIDGKDRISKTALNEYIYERTGYKESGLKRAAV